MQVNRPLSSRIVIAFFLLALCISGFFVVSIVLLVHKVEKELLTRELQRDLVRVYAEQLQHGSPVLEPDTQYMIVDAVDGNRPEWLAGVDGGFSEIQYQGRDYYVWLQEAGDKHFVLLRDQGNFEKRERRLYYLLTGIFLISLAIAWIVGRSLVLRVISPVVRLSNDVRQRENVQQALPPLVPQYPDDEVGQLARAFDNTLNKLVAALQRERLFTSDVSHEFRTPLMVIGSTCELLLANPATDSRQQQQVKRIASACDEMLMLVRTFLLLARDAKQETDTPKATLSTAAQEALARWTPLAESRGLQLLMETRSADNGYYHAAFLTVVLNNLLRNALHYCDAGEVTLILDKGTFTVRDTGRGIPDNLREKLFEPFVRGSDEKGEGLGLGLSLVKRICHHEGWTVSHMPVQPHGSAFTVTLQTTDLQ